MGSILMGLLFGMFIVYLLLFTLSKTSVYSLSITRTDRTLEEIPLCTHYYLRWPTFCRELNMYIYDAVNAGYEVDSMGDTGLFIRTKEWVTQLYTFHHPKTGARLTMTVQVVPRFREFSDGIRRAITKGKNIPENEANTIRKEVLANRYPELADKRYYVYPVLKLVVDPVYAPITPEIRLFRSLDSALEHVQNMHSDLEIVIEHGEYPVEFKVQDNEGYLWKYQIDRQLF